MQMNYVNPLTSCKSLLGKTTKSVEEDKGIISYQQKPIQGLGGGEKVVMNF